MHTCRVCLCGGNGGEDREGGGAAPALVALSARTRDMMLSCLQLTLDDDTARITVLCGDCSTKLQLFSEFKQLAFESHQYFNSIKTEPQEYEDYLKEERILKENYELTYDQMNPEVEEEIDREKVYMKDEFIYEEKTDSEDHLLQDFVTSNRPIELLVDLPHRKVTKNSKVTKKRKEKSKKEKKSYSGHKPGMCETCGKHVKDLGVHMQVHSPPVAKERKACPHCHKTFASYSARRKHVKVKHLGVTTYCNICKKSVQDIRSHHLRIHDRESLPFECVVCNKKFTSRSLVEIHMASHTRNKPFECTECGNRFQSRSTMERHRRSVHDGERPHTCEYCSKGFSKKNHLIFHIRTHTKEKPFACEECGKCFLSQDRLKIHIKRHQGIKHHKCDRCDMAFVTHVGLKTHTISHTKEKKFECKYCGVKFGRSDHRNRHERTAHDKITLDTER